MRWASYAFLGLLVGTSLADGGCGSSATPSGMENFGATTDAGSGGGSGAMSPGSSSGGNSGSGSGGMTQAAPGSSSGGSIGSSSSNHSGGSSGTKAGSSSGSGSSSGAGVDGGSGGSGGADSGAACMKGQVTNMEVVMLGDSYLDIGNVGPTIQMVANATYRTYYLAGAALNYGSGQGNIPYQFDSMAVPANPDINVIIMDGGGNDILINNSQCLSTPPAGDTMCHMVIQQSVMRAQQLFQDAVAKGVQHTVYFFYPHIDPSVGANANDWLDFAYPLAAQVCCGSNTPAQGASDYTCEGTASGMQCVFIDTRPEFVGHNMSGSGDYWFQDGIHPTQPGADAIANKVWAQMQKYCIAQ